MQVTFGEDGSGFSKAQPLFFPVVVKKGDAPPLRLPLVRRRRLREEERETGPAPSRAARPGLRMDLVSFMEEEEEERREVKQMKSSLVVAAAAVVLVLLPPVLVVRKWGLSAKSITIFFSFFLFLFFTAS